MPVVRVLLIEGYGAQVRRRLGQALTDAVRLVIDAPKDAVIVATEEVAPENYMRGGETRQPGRAVADPVEAVQTFLGLMSARDLAGAQACLAPGAEMVFPGGRRFTALADMVAWGATRYAQIDKSFEGFDVSMGAAGPVVSCRGTLSGVWTDGTPFSGIRFTDRFELTAEGLISGQEVWNDLGEARAPA
ncbi:tautomerase family protein [Roseibium aestuarii]|uniref:Tautomerase family protein n=1 Tax=Roseibium aestuarii TaxID=2600299 RepID=A0ABW4JUP1_9HYPH|nr:tautomerase family protein [Roseibium aestuarii]